MTLIIFTTVLFGCAFGLGVAAARREDDAFWGGVRDARQQLLFTAPRLLLGVVGAGFLAELLPEEFVRTVLGKEAGFLGVLLATAIGAVTPGGPPLVFAVAGVASLAGAGEGQIIAFTTAWMLFSFNKALVWETPFLGATYVRDRLIVSAPIPVVVGALGYLLLD